MNHPHHLSESSLSGDTHKGRLVDCESCRTLAECRDELRLLRHEKSRLRNNAKPSDGDGWIRLRDVQPAMYAAEKAQSEEIARLTGDLAVQTAQCERMRADLLIQRRVIARNTKLRKAHEARQRKKARELAKESG